MILKKNKNKSYHMIQQSHTWAYIWRKPYLEKIRAPKCSLQHYLQQDRMQPKCPSAEGWIKKMWYIYI